MGGGYIWTHIDSGKAYVGVSEDLEVRKKAHLYAIRSGRGCYAFHNAVRKYGEDAFTYEEVFWSDDREELVAWEIAEIARRETFTDPSKGYNLTPGGDGFSVLTPESKAKKSANLSIAAKADHAKPGVKEMRSASAKAAMARPEVKAKLAASFALPGFKEKKSASIKAAFARPEVKAKLSASIKAACARPGARERKSAATKAVHARPEVKAKISAKSKANWACPDYREKVLVTRGAPRILAEGVFYPGPLAAARNLGIHAETVTRRAQKGIYFSVPRQGDPECDAVEECWALMQWATANPDHANVPDWLQPDRPKHGVAPAWAKRAAA